MKIFIIATILSIAKFCSAQKKDTMFLNANGSECARTEAETYRITTKEGSKFIIKDYYIKNNGLAMSGAFDSKHIDRKTGQVTYFDKAGFKTNKGSYKSNMHEGKWITWDDNEADSTISEFQPNGEIFILNKGHYTSLQGKKQFVIVEGEKKGKPTIVFLSGKGRMEHDFRDVYKEVKKTNQIFAYDRAGIGQSESLNNSRTIDVMANELNELLMLENIAPPYILVGHSLGGHIMRCFMNLYPEKVAGLIFVDPTSEARSQDIILKKSDRKIYDSEMRGYSNNIKKTVGEAAESKYCFDPDTSGYATNHRLVKDLKFPVEIPVTVVVSTKEDIHNQFSLKEINYRLKFFRNWKEKNPNMKLVLTAQSSHFIQMDEPELVISEINEVLSGMKGK